MWESDNAIFNVNGIELSKLQKTLALAFGEKNVAGYQFIKEKGLCFYSWVTDKGKIIPFPTPISPTQAAIIAFDWLKSSDAKLVPREGWDANADHDGSNELGWRVYTEDWGHINGEDAIAIKPAYLWYGK